MSEKFQIVGSLLRPQNLLAYKSQIEKRDDIQSQIFAFPAHTGVVLPMIANYLD